MTDRESPHADAVGSPTAVIVTQSWAGRRTWACTILAETPKRYRVRLDVDAVLPSGRRAAGDVLLVPKSAVQHAPR